MKHSATYKIGLIGIAALLVASPIVAATVPSDHTDADCSACHGDGNSPSRNPEPTAAKCLNCHNSSELEYSSASFHRNSSGRCLSCHSYHSPTEVIIRTGLDETTSHAAIGSATCRGCHAEGGDLTKLSPGHREAARFYHAEAAQLQNVSPSQTCLYCHSKQTRSHWRSGESAGAAAFAEHASHPVGVPVIPGRGDSNTRLAMTIDKRLPLFDGRMECQTCHLLSADTKDLLTPFDGPKQLCLGCHQFQRNQQLANSRLDNVGAAAMGSLHR